MIKGRYIAISLLVSLVLLCGLLCIALSIAVKYIDPYEKVQIRNALVLRLGETKDFDWEPGSEPKGYILEKKEDIPKFMIEEANNILKNRNLSGQSDFKKAIAIAEHLLSAERKGWVYIDSFTEDAYKKIFLGLGVCSDYSQVFTGLCNAADIPARAWAVNSESFTGHGNSFVEIYDKELRKWIFIDIWNSVFVKDSKSSMPLSFLEFRARVLNESKPEISIEYLKKPQVRKSNYKIKDYEKSYLCGYKEESKKAYLIFGNNVFGEDKFWLNKMFIPRSREIAQLGSIILNRFPKFVVVKDKMDESVWNEILSLKKKIYSVFILSILFFIATFTTIILLIFH